MGVVLGFLRRRGAARLLLCSVTAVGLVACAPHSPARGVDQQNVGETAITDYIDGYTCDGVKWVSEVGQTFVAGRTGLLDRVSLNFGPISASSTPPIVTIRTVRADGAPGETVLGSGSYAGPGTPPGSSGLTVDVAMSRPAFVIAGHHYALVVGVPSVVGCPSGSIYGWYVFGTTNLYAHGELWSRGNLYARPDWVKDYEGNHDLLFKTWVTGAHAS